MSHLISTSWSTALFNHIGEGIDSFPSLQAHIPTCRWFVAVGVVFQPSQNVMRNGLSLKLTGEIVVLFAADQNHIGWMCAVNSKQQVECAPFKAAQIMCRLIGLYLFLDWMFLGVKDDPACSGKMLNELLFFW